ncbi:hypothetical protein HYALB_00002877 [Hymenoscyphus albidus]|uniref:Uncharacterized protein n=1 Tax=Hymenoscyphus albidus TaxID=595503 RepID=A0A9N9LL89_9HELO|nr:hypothetical protein HYALB_00002877 [Hymenoscyphus albidus]
MSYPQKLLINKRSSLHYLLSDIPPVLHSLQNPDFAVMSLELLSCKKYTKNGNKVIIKVSNRSCIFHSEQWLRDTICDKVGFRMYSKQTAVVVSVDIEQQKAGKTVKVDWQVGDLVKPKIS